MKNRDIEAGAKAIAGDQLLPGGRRKKLSRLVADHLAWFDAAEMRGMTWEDMIAALSAAGITRPDGRSLSVGTLSSAVWRKRNQVVPARRPTEMTEPRSQALVSEPSAPPPKIKLSGSRVKSEKRVHPPGVSAKAGQPLDERAKDAGVLAFMHRAAKMRRLDES